MKTSQSRTLFTTTIIFLLALLVLGMALQFFMEDYLKDTTFQRLDQDSQVLSHLVAAYHADDSMEGSQFLINLDLTARVSGIDALICDRNGRILLSSDRSAEIGQQGLRIADTYLRKIQAAGCFHDTGRLQDLYADSRYISARAVVAEGQVVGYVVASSPVSETRVVMRQISEIFATGAIGVMIICVLAMGFFSRLQSIPLQEMARKARAFGHGDLDARVHITGNESREVEELAIAFNNMASSLQKSEYRRQEFVANISHELKNPMTSISGYIDGILDGTIPPEKSRQYLQLVSDETKRLSRLVRSMLDISRLQDQRGIPEEQLLRFDLTERTGQVLISFEQKITDKALDVQVDMPEHPVYVRACEDHITQVIYNLLDNAIKFCPTGGILCLTVREGGGKAYVSIMNSGETIPPEELPLVFDRFHKIDKSRSQNRDSWGLGLYIVKTIIDSHGENISVTSRDNKTTFTFTLPLVN
jgi:signal transduction histidine kinase